MFEDGDVEQHRKVVEEGKLEEKDKWEMISPSSECLLGFAFKIHLGLLKENSRYGNNFLIEVCIYGR